MKLYSQKRFWKWLLFFSATAALLFVLYYSNQLMNEMAQEERKKVNLWAEAVKHKAQLVDSTAKFFEEVKIEEGKRASLHAKVLQKIYDAPFDEDLTFYVDMLQSNKTIPIILAQMDGSIDCTANVPEDVAKMKNTAELGDALNDYVQLQIIYDFKKKRYVNVYYKESRIYTDLRNTLENLQESFFREVVTNTASIPVIITDSTEKNVVIYGNIDSTLICTQNGLAKLINKMKSENKPIEIIFQDKGKCYVFYEESSVLTRLRYFPYIQLLIILVFVITAYLLFSFARRSEQNRVWVGMSKETAHQLGTPISSLMAWTEILKEYDMEQSIVTEINKDVQRLDTIAKRFSKIGSVPELKEEDIVEILKQFIEYLRTRLSKQCAILFDPQAYSPIYIPVNRYLFEWVIENLCKNAVDAMDGSGTIHIQIIEEEKMVHIDITDTGKGLSPKQFKTIFKPGYTSKSRGWGLGLTLAQRMIKEYHKGKLFVKNSTLGKGTTMRISLRHNTKM
jgi:signal transduction histidine kinase